MESVKMNGTRWYNVAIAELSKTAFIAKFMQEGHIYERMSKAEKRKVLGAVYDMLKKEEQ